MHVIREEALDIYNHYSFAEGENMKLSSLVGGGGRLPQVQNWRGAKVHLLQRQQGHFSFRPPAGATPKATTLLGILAGPANQEWRESELVSPSHSPQWPIVAFSAFSSSRQPSPALGQQPVPSPPNAPSLAVAATETHVARRRLPGFQGGMHTRHDGNARAAPVHSRTPLCPSS